MRTDAGISRSGKLACYATGTNVMGGTCVLKVAGFLRRDIKDFNKIHLPGPLSLGYHGSRGAR